MRGRFVFTAPRGLFYRRWGGVRELDHLGRDLVKSLNRGTCKVRSRLLHESGAWNSAEAEVWPHSLAVLHNSPTA